MPKLETFANGKPTRQSGMDQLQRRLKKIDKLMSQSHWNGKIGISGTGWITGHSWKNW
jgi:hypothetical protein